MKKFIKGLLPATLVGIMLLVSACGNNANNSSSNAANSNAGNSTGNAAVVETEKKDPVEVEFWTISLQPTFNDYINGVIAAYEEQNPHVTINWQDYPMDAIQTKLLASTASGDAPDVVNLNTETSIQMVNVGALSDITPYITNEIASSYIDGIYNATTQGDKAYAFPWYTSIQVLFMNSELLEKAGLDPTKGPATRDEMHIMARQIKEATGAAGYSTQFTARNNLANEGINILNEDRTAAAFNTPEGVAVIDEFKSLVEEGIILKEIANHDAQVQYYASEQTAFMLSGPTFINRLKTTAEDVAAKTVVVPLPTGKGNVNYSSTMNLVVPNGSKNPQEAANFAAFVTNAENQLEFSKVANTIASSKGSLEDAYFTESDGSLEGNAKLATVEGLKYAAEYALGVPKVSDINSTVGGAIERVILNGEDTITALNKAAEEVNKILALEN